MKRVFPFVIVLLVLIGLGVWWFSPTQVIKRRTRDFLDVLTVESSSGKPARQMKSFSFNGMVAAEVKLENPTLEELNMTYERGDLESGFSWLINHARSTRFEVLDFQNVSVSGETAQVDFTMDGLVELPTYRPADGKYDVTFFWQKEKDGWRLTSASWVEKN